MGISRDKFLGLDMPPCLAQRHPEKNECIELWEDDVWEVQSHAGNNCEEHEVANRQVIMENLQHNRSLHVTPSSPIRVPPWPSTSIRGTRTVTEEVGDGEDRERLPPHMQLALCNAQGGTALSVMEGAGRTLKGRDLCNVRNAVWHCTGFIP